MSSLNIDGLYKAMELLTPPVWESVELDEFMKHDSNIHNVILIVPFAEMKDIGWVMTKYGRLNIRYNRYDIAAYFMRMPDFYLS
jgi:hypothetical protein